MYTPKKVLVAEDDLNIRTLIEESLNSNYDVISVDNGFSALTKAKEEMPGLIIMDLFLPRMDGVTVCRKLRADEATRNIPILVVSAHAKRELIVVLLKLGIKNFLAKPFDVDILVKRVNELYVQPTMLQKLTNLKVKYALANEVLNIKLTGELASHDLPVLLSDISNQAKERTKKIILNLNDLSSFGMDEVNIIEQIKNYFEADKIDIKITAGNSSSLRTNLIKNSILKENLLTN